jgi:hypothetical protein
MRWNCSHCGSSITLLYGGEEEREGEEGGVTSLSAAASAVCGFFFGVSDGLTVARLPPCCCVAMRRVQRSHREGEGGHL